MNIKKILPVIFIVLLAVAALALKRCNNDTVVKQTNATSKTNNDRQVKFDRNVSKFFFTKHARCRMKCRQITQKEIKEILVEGTINYNKSDLQNSRCPRYAIEGVTSDNQDVRIIFAQCNKSTTVVTVIDLDKQWQCDCPGDD